VGFADAGPPGARPPGRRGGDDRAAGAGIAMAVGMAIAEKHLAAVYNRPGFDVVNHHTYAMLGDGDLMEGVSHEAASLAGTLALGKLIFLYDDNQISLDGPTSLSYTEDRWSASRLTTGTCSAWPTATTWLRWRRRLRRPRPRPASPRSSPCAQSSATAVPRPAATSRMASRWARRPSRRPRSSLAFRRIRALWFPMRRSQTGARRWTAVRAWRPRGRSSSRATGWPTRSWRSCLSARRRRTQGRLGEGDSQLPGGKAIATRNAGGTVMNAIAGQVPELFGGAADLTSSTKTIFKPGANFHEDPDGRNVFFGVREFGMCAAVNGIAAHGGLIPFGSTFFVFSDYAKPAIRLAALMQVHSLFVFTHDSVALGEDGPPTSHRATDGLPRDSRAYGFPARGRQRDGSGMEAGSGTQGAELLCAQPAGFAGD